MRTQVHTLPAENGATAFLEAHSDIIEPVDHQAAFEFYAFPPSPGDSFWLGFTADHDPKDARAVFRRRYGRQPQYVFPALGLLLAGPILEVTA